MVKLKGSKLYSIVYNKCPRCQNGDLFLSHAYDLKNTAKMQEKCVYCKQRYELEPSFYSGAMYVSYALQVALFAAVYVVLRLLLNPSMDVYIYSICSALILLFPRTL